MIPGPITRYKLFWRGEWRAVTNMFCGRQEVFDPLRANSAVVYITDDHWLAVEVFPGDLMERFEHDPDADVWQLIH